MPPKRHRNPFHGVRDLISEMNRMADRMAGFDTMPVAQERNHTDAWSPATDIVARGADLIIRCELPGVTLADVEVNLSTGLLTISGQRGRGPEPDEDYYVRERYAGRFRREISLPQGVRNEDIEASLDDGVLEVVVRNCALAPGPRPIQVTKRSSSARPDQARP